MSAAAVEKRAEFSAKSKAETADKLAAAATTAAPKPRIAKRR